MINQIKELLTVEAPSDSKIYMYIKVATRLIKNYLNNDKFTDESIEVEHEIVICMIVANAINNDHNGVKSISEGEVSTTYFDNKAFYLTDDIKALLPIPYVKMF